MPHEQSRVFHVYEIDKHNPVTKTRLQHDCPSAEPPKQHFSFYSAPRAPGAIGPLQNVHGTGVCNEFLRTLKSSMYFLKSSPESFLPQTRILGNAGAITWMPENQVEVGAAENPFMSYLCLVGLQKSLFSRLEAPNPTALSWRPHKTQNLQLEAY